MKIVISGGWSYGNIGDEAIAESTLFLFNKYFPTVEKIVTSYDPSDFYRHHKIMAIESCHARVEKVMGKDAIEIKNLGSEKQIKKYLDLFDKDTVLVLSGGGYIIGEWHSQIFSQIFQIEQAKKRGAYVSIIGQSIGPIADKRLEKMFVKALDKVDFISVRDYQSIEYLRRLGVKKEIFLAPDIAIIVSDIYKKNISSKKYVAMMPACYTKYQDVKIKENNQIIKYMEKIINRYYLIRYRYSMVELVKELGTRYNINFVSSTDWKGDKNFVDYLIKKSGITNYEVNNKLTIAELCNELSGGEITISGKMHPIIISSSYGIPSIGISYNFKTDYFMESLKRKSRCYRVNSLRIKEMIKMINNDISQTLSFEMIQEKKCKVYQTMENLNLNISEWRKNEYTNNENQK